jgi:hypothetical protein
MDADVVKKLLIMEKSRESLYFAEYTDQKVGKTS